MYFNPGDDRCYSPSLMQNRKNTLEAYLDVIFSMKIEYVPEDNCTGPSCATLKKSKCPIG